MNPVTGIGCTSVDIGDNANLELVDKFCYLDDMLSVDRDADAAVEIRIRIGRMTGKCTRGRKRLQLMSNICEGYETAKKRAEDRCL